jgi:hypothetical protein
LGGAGFRFSGSDGQHAKGQAEGQEKGNKFFHGNSSILSIKNKIGFRKSKDLLKSF